MNINQALKQYTAAQIDQNDVEILLAHAIEKSRAFIIAHPEYKLTKKQESQFKKYVKKRKEGIPVAYIKECKEFYSLDFKVNKHTLIPRPETELMVNKVIEKNKENKVDLLIDIGTGSGCIPISILKNTSKPTRAIAVDISKRALKVAKQNAKKHNADIEFKQGNLLELIKKDVEQSKNIIITANLPYITQEQFDSEPSIQKEPKQALVADNEGLKYYEELLEQLASLDIDNKNIDLYFEIDPNQSKKVKEVVFKYLPKSKIEIKKDLKENDRLVEITY